MPRASLVFALVLPLVGCSSSSDSESGNPGEDTGVSYAFSYTTQPGKETHWCQYARMPKSASGDVLVTRYAWSWQGLHHWALYRTTPDLPSNIQFDQPFDCFAPGGMKYAQPAALVLGIDPNGTLSFPAGMGFAFESEEVVIVQAHTLNTTANPVHLSLDVHLSLGDERSVPNRLGLIQFYDPYIFVPAHTDAKAQMRCKMPADATIVQASTHEHTRGIGVRTFLDEPDGTEGTTPIIESTSWENATVSTTPLTVKAGSYLRTVCDYHGDDHDVIQGQDKNNNEMCMYIGYYYPPVPAEDHGGLFENCVQTPIPGGVGDRYGTGTKTCSESLSCIQSCPPGDAPRPGDGRIDVGACWQKCLVDSCPSASAPLNDVGYCVQSSCADDCAKGGSECTSCVLSKCSKPLGTCQASACK